MSSGKVVMEGYCEDSENWEEIKSVLEEYAKKLGVTIVVNYSEEGHLSLPRHAHGKLFINIFSGPLLGIFSSWKNEEYLERLFGKDVCEEYVECSPVGIKMADSEGVVAAEVVEGTLFVLPDLPHCDEAGEIMRKIMEKYITVPRKLADREAIVRRNIARIQKDSWKNFVEIFRIKEKRGILERNVTQIRERYNDLVAIAKSENLLVLPGEIRVCLGQIKHEIVGDIGEFILVIGTKSGDGESGIKAVCITPNIEHEHPHMWSDSGVCLGNIENGVGKLIEQKEYAFLVETMADYLRTG